MSTKNGANNNRRLSARTKKRTSDRHSQQASFTDPLDQALETNIAVLKQLMGNSPDLIFRRLRLGHERRLPVAVVFIDNMVETAEVSESILKPLLQADFPFTRTNVISLLREHVLETGQLASATTYQEVATQVLSGHAVVIVDGSRTALACDVSMPKSRAITEPDSETVARGPREGFNESLQEGVGLLRRRLRTSNLRFEAFVIGKESRTSVLLAYLESVIAPALLDEARSRLGRIGDRIDGLTSSQSLVELIEDHPYGLFPTTFATERPDRVAAALMQGRFAIMVDGDPFTIVAPITFGEFLGSTADHSEIPLTATFLRWLRTLALFQSLFLPSLYVALVSFHQEMLPTTLLLSISAGREGVPLPAVGEALLMEGAFEVLREAGLRLPRPIGNAISIVGVLVLGQASVEANIVSPLMIIIVGATAIASFTIPNYPAANIVRILRFPILLMAGIFGAAGIVFCFILLTLHVVSLRSFGAPYLFPVAPFSFIDALRAFFRYPRWKADKRWEAVHPKSSRRQDENLMPRPEGDSQ